MKTFYIRTLFLCIITLVAACEKGADTPDKSIDILQRAESYFKQGQFSAASIEAKNAIKQNNKNVDAYVLLARIFHEQGNYPQSVSILKDLPQDNLDVALLTGENYLYQAKYKSLNTLIGTIEQRTDAQASWSFQRLATLNLIYHDRFAEALKKMDSTAKMATTPEQKATLEVVRAIYHAKRNETAAQLASLDKALSFNPQDIDALVQKARLRIGQDELDSAEDLLSQALIALPTTDTMTLKRIAILQAMVSTLSRQGRSGEALIYSKLIAEANPKAQEIQTEFQQGVDSLKDGKIKQAEETFAKLYANSHTRLAGSMLGMIRYQQGEYEEAAHLFDETVDPETAAPELLKAYAESQLRLRNPELALRTIEANVKEHPENPDILGVYGLALLAIGQQEKAVKTLQSVLAIDPKRSRIRLALAQALNGLGKQEDALQQIRTAFDNDKTDIAIQEYLLKQLQLMKKNTEIEAVIETLSTLPAANSQALASLALLRTDPTRAAALLDAAYKAAPADSSVLKAQIIRHTFFEDYEKVVRFGKEMVSLNPNDLSALSATLQAYRKMGKTADGIGFLEQLSKDNANAWGADYVLAYLKWTENDIENAIKYADAAVTRSTFNRESVQLSTQIYYAAAERLAHNHDYANARETIMEALQNNESNPQLIHLLINVELSDNNAKEAEKLLAELNQSAPGSHIAYFATGDVAANKGDTTVALENYKSAWNIKPSDRLGAALWNSMKASDARAREAFLEQWSTRLSKSFTAKTMAGIYYQEAGSADNAIRLYKESLAILPGQPAVHNNIAWLLMEKNQLPDALVHAKQAAKLNPENASILDTLGWIAFKSGDKSTALTSLEKAATLNPSSQEIRAHLETVKGTK